MNHHNQFVPLEDANNRNPEGNNCPWYWLLITFFMLLIGFVVAALMFIQTEDLLFAFLTVFFALALIFLYWCSQNARNLISQGLQKFQIIYR